MAQKKTTPKSRALARSAGRAAGAQRAAAKKTSAKQERAAVSRSISKPTKVAEQGVGWGNVARAAATGFARWERSSQRQADQKWLSGGGPERYQQREAGRAAAARKNAQMGQPKRKPKARP